MNLCIIVNRWGVAEKETSNSKLLILDKKENKFSPYSKDLPDDI